MTEREDLELGSSWGIGGSLFVGCCFLTAIISLILIQGVKFLKGMDLPNALKVKGKHETSTEAAFSKGGL